MGEAYNWVVSICLKNSGNRAGRIRLSRFELTRERCRSRTTANKGLHVGSERNWASDSAFALEWHPALSSADSQLFDTGWEDESCWRMLEKLWCRVVEHSELSWLLVPRSDADRDCWHCSFHLILIHCLVVQEDIFLALEWSFSSLLTWLWNREPIVFFGVNDSCDILRDPRLIKDFKNSVTFYT